MNAFPAVDACRRRLHRAGWSVGECATEGTGGREVWRVTGTNGENQFDAAADTQAGAGHRPGEPARALGKLRS